MSTEAFQAGPPRLIEHVTWMNSRYGGRQGWKLSGRMSTALRQLADKVDAWRDDTRLERREKDERLVAWVRSPPEPVCPERHPE
jgi:hypothetical protein